MTVTSIKQCKRKNYCNVFIDGEFAFCILEDTRLKYSVSEGCELDNDTTEEIKKFDKTHRAKNKAFDLLSRKDYSTKGIKRKLIEKGIDRENAESITGYLEERGFLDDEKYAVKGAEYLFEVKKYGKIRVFSELIVRGIDRERAEEAVSGFESISEENISELLKGLIKNRDITNKKELKQIFDKLIRFGYSYDEIRTALKTLSQTEE